MVFEGKPYLCRTHKKDRKYNVTRGYWTAMLALIKVDEIAQNLKHFYMEKIFKNGAIFWE